MGASMSSLTTVCGLFGKLWSQVLAFPWFRSQPAPEKAKSVAPATRKMNLLAPRSFEAAGGGGDMSKKCSEETTGVAKAKASAFWGEYQKLASPTMGFFGERPAVPEARRLRAVVELAEKGPEVFARCDAERMRAYIQEQFEALGDVAELIASLEGLRHCELKCVLSALVYIRHMFHQGDPSKPPMQSVQVVLEDGTVLDEPPALKALCDRLSTMLGVNPYLNLTNWVLFNWETDDNADYQRLVENPALLKMRFQWFRGVAGRTEENFWRAFAISEVHAVPMYGAVGSLFEAFAERDEETMTSSLQTLSAVLQNLIAVFSASVKPELIDIAYFNQMQNTAHFGMASAGAGGFQLPWIMTLDALLGVGNLPAKTREVWEENLQEVHASLRHLVRDSVLETAPALRKAIAAASDPALRDAFNEVVSTFVKWRAMHRARASKWLEPSTVTTGRDYADLEGNVKASFHKDMDHLIASTRAQSIRGEAACEQSEKAVSACPFARVSRAFSTACDGEARNENMKTSFQKDVDHLITSTSAQAIRESHAPAHSSMPAGAMTTCPFARCDRHLVAAGGGHADLVGTMGDLNPPKSAQTSHGSHAPMASTGGANAVTACPSVRLGQHHGRKPRSFKTWSPGHVLPVQ
eukprot:TRINITY_DN38335_c0_g1_i1.p1 TRINITY_DN38335_c0_g1~~TRINITY_DN38335_c0_g1_i1.p1  ORF type:complete len:638 (-),score=100.35 TRINITY_DN38335_c0_g1_i1:533-2446(-)